MSKAKSVIVDFMSGLKDVVDSGPDGQFYLSKLRRIEFRLGHPLVIEADDRVMTSAMPESVVGEKDINEFLIHLSAQKDVVFSELADTSHGSTMIRCERWPYHVVIEPSDAPTCVVCVFNEKRSSCD